VADGLTDLYDSRLKEAAGSRHIHVTFGWGMPVYGRSKRQILYDLKRAKVDDMLSNI